MPIHPSTSHSAPDTKDSIGWDDRAALHRIDDGGGMFSGGKMLRSGTFADLIRHVTLLPEAEQMHYAIEKAGDRRFGPAEIRMLAARGDFPRSAARRTRVPPEWRGII